VEAVGSMGTDTPLAVLSDKPQPLYNYFKQLFAQVTNPPIDCIREEIVTSAETTIGSERDLLKPEPMSCHLIELKSPILTNEEFAKLKQAEDNSNALVTTETIAMKLPAIVTTDLRLNTPEVRINIVSEGAGDINESDVQLASASEAVVIGFNTKLDPGAQRAVDASGVDVRLYDVIYKLTDDLGAALRGMLAPKLIEQVEGHAEVRMVIKAGKAGNVAGSYVVDGRIVRGAPIRLFRGGKVEAEGRVESLKRFKDDVREVAMGFECGIGLGSLEIAEGDLVECYQMVAEQA